jgi:drug/metabolite transporter (DMT)-like permease
MGYLAAVSIMWAFSFGLIGRFLAGLDPQCVAFARLLISLAVFAPWIRRQGLTLLDVLRLTAIGAVQYGLMYSAYIQSYRYMPGHEVALYTITTPIFVTLLDDVRRGRFQRAYFVAAALAVAGGAALTGLRRIDGGILPGILLVQVSNICFAAGQVEYRLFCEKALPGRSDAGGRHFGFLFLGAVLTTGFLASGNMDAFRPSPTQWAALLYLGAVPSAIGFFLWNFGARRVNAGTLAVFNNVKIPLAIVVSLVFFKEDAEWVRLAAGVAGIAAGFAAASRLHRPPSGLNG